MATSVGDEGGFAPNLGDNEEALTLLVEAIKMAGYGPGEDISLCIDAAANSFFINGSYEFAAGEKEEKDNLSIEELVDVYERWVSEYPIVSIEDGLAEDDNEGWKLITSDWVAESRLLVMMYL